MSETVHRLDGAASRVEHVRQDLRHSVSILALADAVAEVIAFLRGEPVTYAPVTPLHTRIVPEPRLREGETLGDYWNRTGEASTEWARKHVIPLTEEEDRDV